MVTRVVPIVATLLVVAPLAAQEEATPPSQELPGSTLRLLGGADYQFESSIDEGGELKAARFGAGFQIDTPLSQQTRMTTRLAYEFNDYEFAGMTSLGAETLWDEVHIAAFTLSFAHEVDNDWTIFGGPVVQLAWEAGADVDEGMTAGGFFGARLNVDEDLTIGFGLGVSSQIQDGALFWPLPILDWAITDTLRLSTRTLRPFSTGVELVYDMGTDWEIGGGVSYRLRRFRLDEAGLAPLGVGEEKMVTVYARATYSTSAAASLTLYAGFAANGELEVERADGGIIGTKDYDPAGVVGVAGSIRF